MNHYFDLIWIWATGLVGQWPFLFGSSFWRIDEKWLPLRLLLPRRSPTGSGKSSYRGLFCSTHGCWVLYFLNCNR